MGCCARFPSPSWGIVCGTREPPSSPKGSIAALKILSSSPGLPDPLSPAETPTRTRSVTGRTKYRTSSASRPSWGIRNVPSSAPIRFGLTRNEAEAVIPGSMSTDFSETLAPSNDSSTPIA
jgi:hypothetical protein